MSREEMNNLFDEMYYAMLSMSDEEREEMLFAIAKLVMDRQKEIKELEENSYKEVRIRKERVM